MSDQRRAGAVFVNLPVGDVARSQAFFESLGFAADPRFSAEDRAACIVLSDTVFAMLLSRETFSGFAPKPVSNAVTTTGVLVALHMESRDAIDAVMNAALDAGATEPRGAQDTPAMYGRAFEDPDGHIWELLWIDTDG